MDVERFACWWCGGLTPLDELSRLGDISSLAGYAPGQTGNSGIFRVCRNCIVKFAGLREAREFELRKMASKAA